MNKTSEALDHYRVGLKMAEETAAADPNSYRAQRDLMVTLNRVGDVEDKKGQKQEALASYQRAFTIVSKLEVADHRASLQRDLTTGYDRVGGELLAIGDKNAGLEQLRKGLALRQKMAADGKDAQAQRDLMLSFVTVAETLTDMHRYEDAIDQARRGLAIAETQSAADNADALSRRYIAVASEKLASAYAARAAAKSSKPDWSEARRSYQHAVEAMDTASAKGAALPSDAEGRAHLVAGIERCDRAAKQKIAVP